MGAKAKVLHIVTKMVQCGGASLTVKLAAEAQSATGSPFEAALAHGVIGTDEDALEVADRVSVFHIPDLVREIAPWRDRRGLQQLREVIRQYQPDVVHTHSSKAGVLGRTAARAEGVPLIVHHVHGWGFHDAMPAAKRSLYVHIERRMARRCDALLMVAQADVEIARRYRIGQPHQWRIIRSGIEVDDFPATSPQRRERARKLLGLPADRFVVGTVAQMRPQKSPLDFVGVAARVAREAPEATFVWVGDGQMRAQVEAAVQGAGLQDRFLLTGSRDDVQDLYPAFDVFLLTSLWEGLPRTVVEACVVGVPVVATSVAGTAEAIRDGHNGLLAPTGDVEGLAGRVLELRARPDLCATLCANAATARDEFSIARSLADLERLYLELLAAKTEGARDGG